MCSLTVLKPFTVLLDYVLCGDVARRVGGTLANGNNMLIEHLTVLHFCPNTCSAAMLHGGRKALLLIDQLTIFSLLLDYVLCGGCRTAGRRHFC